jgi:hypothetical protein
LQAGDRSKNSIAFNDRRASKNCIKKIENGNSSIRKYIENVSIMNESTASQYQIRLKTFVSFVEQEFEYNTDILLEKLKEHNIDVYDVLAMY